MATHARQQYFADENSLSKENREFSIADDIQQKINGIEPGAQVNKIETVKVNGTTLIPDANKAVNVEVPEVIDNLYTVDPDNALSAKQGKLLYDYIQNIASRGRFLSNWNSATGLPMTNPSESPYPYKSGDYFIVSNIAGSGGTNYRPDGSSYIIGQASTAVETDSVDVSDFYFYDGTNWLLLKNSGRSGAVDSALSTTSTNPVENRVITNALNGKQDTLIAGTNIQIAADGKTVSATDTTYTAGTGINIDANNVISNTQTSAEWGNITGTLSDQTDLNTALSAKADDSGVVHLAGDETITGVKTFTANNGAVDGAPAIITPRIRITGQANSTRVKSQLDIYKGSTKKGYLGYFEMDGLNRFEFASEDTSIPFYLGLMPWKKNNLSIALTNQGIWRGGTSDTFSADKVFAVIGDLDNRIFSGTTAPSSPAQGSLWYDTTNNVLKVYDGAQWNAIDTNTTYTAGNGIDITNNEISADTTVLATQTDLNSKQDTLVSGTNIKTVNNESLLGTGNITTPDTTYTAGTGIEIKNGNDYSALKGPCSNGYHIPTQPEFDDLVTKFLSLGLGRGTFYTYYKVPMAGFAGGDSGYSFRDTGTQAKLVLATAESENRTYYTYVTTDYVAATYNLYKGYYGYSIRPFKNEPAIPDSNWTVLYQGTGNAGIYYNATEGLISLSTDGATRITVADKNLGATQVWNSGDTLSEANCGKFYQWGNNYGFPGVNSDTSGVVTSSTKVDASSYGPGEYSSSTFIITGADWSSVTNNNLWGGVTGVIEYHNAITNTGMPIVLTLTPEGSSYRVSNEEWGISNTTNIQTIETMCTLLKEGKNFCLKIEIGYPGSGHYSYLYPRDFYDVNLGARQAEIRLGTPVQKSHTGSGPNRELGLHYREGIGRYAIYNNFAVVTSVNGSSFETSVTINAVPSGGTTGQVLTKTSSGYNWQDASGGLQIAPNSPITGIKYIWYGTEADYNNLNQYYTDTPGDTEFRCF